MMCRKYALVFLQAGGAQIELHAHAVSFDRERDRANQQGSHARALDHIILRAAAQRPHRDLVILEPRIDDQWHFRDCGAKPLEGLHALAVRQVEVEQNGVKLAAGQQLQAFGETGSDRQANVQQSFRC